MVDLFVLKLLFSFLIGGVYSVSSTVIADKLGARIGGLITGLPSTVLFGLVFISWTQSPAVGVQATTLLPAVLGLSCLLLVLYVFFLRYGLLIAVSVSLLFWGISAFVLVILHVQDFLISTILFFGMFLGAHNIFRKNDKDMIMGRIIDYTPRLLMARGLLSGGIIATSVIIAKVGGPLVGGVFAAFPAMFISVLLISYLSHGKAFSTQVARNSLYGLPSTFIFVLAARYTLLPLGIVWGVVFSLLASYLSAYLIFTYVLKKGK